MDHPFLVPTPNELIQIRFRQLQVAKYPTNHPLKKLGTKNMVQQDNTSTINLAKGGQRVCGKRTRNIDIRYFYITEWINDGLVVVSYCSTKVNNYLSKPLQGPNPYLDYIVTP